MSFVVCPTYFVVDTTELSGSNATVMSRDDDPLYPWWKERFDEPDFPLLAVSAIPVTSSLRAQLTSETVELTAVPDNIHLKAASRGDSTLCNSAYDVDKGFDRIRSRLAGLNIAEAMACDLTDLFVSALSADGCHRFLTQRCDAVYVTVTCQVRMRVQHWYDFPRCRTVLQWLSRLARPESMQGTWPASKVRRSSFGAADLEAKDAMDDECRSEVCGQAQSTGPRIGSFIPCELYFAGKVYERDCIAEITGPFDHDGQSCILHLLTSRCNFRYGKGFTLQIPDWNRSVIDQNCERFVEFAEVMHAEPPIGKSKRRNH